MILTDEQIQKAIDRKESFALTDKEIEKLWYEASLKEYRLDSDKSGVFHLDYGCYDYKGV